MAYPRDIGSAETTVLFTGPPAVWSRHEEMLVVLGGRSRHVAEDTTTANLLAVGFTAFYIPALAAFVEAAEYLLNKGVSVGLLRETAVLALETLPYGTEDAATAIASGNFETDQATVEAALESLRSALGPIRKAGQHARTVTAALENLETAAAAGLGKLGLPSQSKVFSGADPA